MGNNNSTLNTIGWRTLPGVSQTQTHQLFKLIAIDNQRFIAISYTGFEYICVSVYDGKSESWQHFYPTENDFENILIGACLDRKAEKLYIIFDGHSATLCVQIDFTDFMLNTSVKPEKIYLESFFSDFEEIVIENNKIIGVMNKFHVVYNLNINNSLNVSFREIKNNSDITANNNRELMKFTTISQWQTSFERKYYPTIMTDCARYIMTFGAHHSENDHYIHIRDLVNQTTSFSPILCPSFDRIFSEVVYLHNDEYDYIVTNAFIHHCYQKKSLKKLQLLPVYLILCISKWFAAESVHFCTDNQHWKIDLDKLLFSSN